MRRNAFQSSTAPRREAPARGSAQQRRLVRTIVLGALAVAAGIWWLAAEIGLDTGELLDYALTSVLMIGGAVGLALAGAGLLYGVRRLRRRQKRAEPFRADR